MATVILARNAEAHFLNFKTFERRTLELVDRNLITDN